MYVGMVFSYQLPHKMHVLTVWLRIFCNLPSLKTRTEDVYPRTTNFLAPKAMLQTTNT